MPGPLPLPVPLPQPVPEPEPEPEPDEPGPDACQALLGLQPGINARWTAQRAPINGHTTVSGAAFRLDAGIAPPPGQATNQTVRNWVRTIGNPKDDAGHVIARRFGGTIIHNGFNGNIFPQNLSINRGMMVVRDRESANEHLRGCDVCVHIGLNYASPGDLRPSELSYVRMVRPPGQGQFNPPVGPFPVPNPP